MKRDDVTEILLSLLRGNRPTGISLESWQEVAKLADKQRLAPLVYSRIKSLDLADQVPPDILQKFRHAYLDTARRNVRIYHELASLLKGFQSEGIACIPLKGIYLAERVYNNIAVRPMTDVDLLVKKGDLARVEQLMLALGYTLHAEDREKTDSNIHFVYSHNQGRFFVEVHWDLINASGSGVFVQIDGVWERTRPVLLAGVPVCEMSAEDQVLFLCIHAAKHDFMLFGLNGIVDLAETIRNFGGPVNWKDLLLRSRQWSAERCLYVGLCQAFGLLGAPVPEEVLTCLRPRQRDLLRLRVAEENLLFGDHRNRKIFAPTKNFARFWVAKGLAEKVRLLWQSLFRSRQDMATMYGVPQGSRRILLYYPVRLLDLWKRYARAIRHLNGRNDQRRSQADHQLQTVLLRDWLFSKDDK